MWIAFLVFAETTEAVMNLIRDLTKSFNAGGFTLRNKISNYKNAVCELSEFLKASSLKLSLNPYSSQRIFGLKWNLQSDSFRVQVNKQFQLRQNASYYQ